MNWGKLFLSCVFLGVTAVNALVVDTNLLLYQTPFSENEKKIINLFFKKNLSFFSFLILSFKAINYLRSYDNRAIKSYEGPCGGLEEVSLTWKTDYIK